MNRPEVGWPIGPHRHMTLVMYGFLYVAAGGAIGAALRHGAGRVAVHTLPPGWPHATFLVNMVGSLVMGLLVGWLALKAEGTSQNLRLFLVTGLLGGFTTFSAFSMEVAQMIEKHELAKAAAYVGLSVGLGVVALFAGLMIARRMFL